MSSSVKAALLANSQIAIAKGIGAFFTGSASMLAETVHSLADCGNQLLLMYGMKSAEKKADSDHPLGYGKNTYFWSFVVAFILFTLGGAYSIYEGYHKLMHPEPFENVTAAIVAVVILAFSFWAELKSFRVCIGEIKEEYQGKSLRWFVKETRRSDLLVVFGEDFAALVGLGIACFSLIMTLITGDGRWDGGGSVVVGCVLAAVATLLFIETKALLIGQSVDPIDRRELHALLAVNEDVEHTYECITLQTGGAEAVLLIRARFRRFDTDTELIDAINRLEDAIVAKFPYYSQIFVEPDNKFDAH